MLAASSQQQQPNRGPAGHAAGQQVRIGSRKYNYIMDYYICGCRWPNLRLAMTKPAADNDTHVGVNVYSNLSDPEDSNHRKILQCLRRQKTGHIVKQQHHTWNRWVHIFAIMFKRCVCLLCFTKTPRALGDMGALAPTPWAIGVY